MANNLRARLTKLERAAVRVTDWQPVVVFYQADRPGSLEEQHTAIFAAAWAKGWRPESGELLAFFMPENGRPHPGRAP